MCKNKEKTIKLFIKYMANYLLSFVNYIHAKVYNLQGTFKNQ